MRLLTRISAIILGAALIIGSSSVGTYAKETAVSGCKHTYVSSVTKEATPAKLTYKYKFVCSKCKAVEKDSKGKTKIYEGKAKIKATPVTKGSLQFKVKVADGRGSMNQLAASINVLANKTVDSTYCSIVKDTKGKYYAISNGFNMLWDNKDLGVTIDSKNKTLTWKCVDKVSSRNQKNLSGFVNVKYSGYTDGTSKVYKVSVTYPKKTKKVK